MRVVIVLIVAYLVILFFGIRHQIVSKKDIVIEITYYDNSKDTIYSTMLNDCDYDYNQEISSGGSVFTNNRYYNNVKHARIIECTKRYK